MTKRSRKKKPEPTLKAETTNSIAAILLIGLTLILILAAVNKAGPAGRFIYTVFQDLFGIGYYLLPLTALAISILFLFSRHKKALLKQSLIGAAVFVGAGLGFIDISFRGHGGIVGRAIGALEIPFGRPASIVLTIVFMLVSLLVTFDTAISFSFLRLFKKSDKEDKAGAVKLEHGSIDCRRSSRGR